MRSNDDLHEPSFERFKKKRKGHTTIRSNDRIKRKDRARLTAEENDCQKMVFLSKHDAELALRRLNSTPNIMLKELKQPYKCSRCGYFHLTSRTRFKNKQPSEPETTPLHIAAKQGDVSKVRALLADPQTNQAAKNRFGKTAFHDAVFFGRTRSVRLMMNHDPRVLDINTPHKQSPLHIACYRGQLTIAQMLIDSGADLHATTSNESTPLHYAADIGHKELYEFLVSLGADPNAQRWDRETPESLLARHQA